MFSLPVVAVFVKEQRVLVVLNGSSVISGGYRIVVRQLATSNSVVLVGLMPN